MTTLTNLHKIIKQNKYIYENLICHTPKGNKNGHRCLTPPYRTALKGKTYTKVFTHAVFQ